MRNQPSEPSRVRPGIPLRKELRIELIPKQIYGKNARAVLSDQAWRQVRKIVHAWHDSKCGECGSSKDLECHEEWEFRWLRRQSENIPVMRLVGLRSLCALCHGGKHLGCTRRKGKLPEVWEHLKTFYELSEEQLKKKERHATEQVTRLHCTKERELDLTYLNDERFASVHPLFGRRLTENEVKNCRESEFDS